MNTTMKREQDQRERKRRRKFVEDDKKEMENKGDNQESKENANERGRDSA